jgi:DNA polymerase-3 subunit delta
VGSTVLVLSSNKLDKRLKFTSACATAGCAVDFQSLSGAALLRQVLRQAKGHELVLERGAAEALVDLVGEDLGEIDTELAKLSLLKEESQAIGPEEVRQLVARSRALDAFEVADLLDASDPLPALRSWIRIRSGRGDAIGTAAILNWRLRQLAVLRTAMEEGDRPADAAKRAGLAPWQARRMEPLARATSLEALERTLSAFRKADLEAKSSSLGSELSYDLALLEWTVENLRP